MRDNLQRWNLIGKTKLQTILLLVLAIRVIIHQAEMSLSSAYNSGNNFIYTSLRNNFILEDFTESSTLLIINTTMEGQFVGSSPKHHVQALRIFPL